MDLRHYFRCIFLFLGVNLYAQELPPITNYIPEEYNGEYQNWAVSQSSSKNIYVANHTSLLEFDGNKWHKYKLPNPSIIRSVKAVGNKIYSGSYREFGYWKKDETGHLNYTSLSDRLKTPLAEDEEFWDILALDHWILFQSLDRIYIYDNQKDTFKIIEARSEKAKLYAVKDNVFFQKAREGLFTIENGESVLVSNDPVFTDRLIIGIYELGDKLVIVTEDSRFYIYDYSVLRPWRTAMDDFDVKLYSSIRLNDESFVLGSISNGLYHLSSEGDLIRNINQAKGLNNNTVLSLFEDIDHNLWLGLDNGLSVINLYSPFNEFVDKLGNLGLVYAAIDHGGYLYLGTNQGLFAKRTDTADKFKLIKGTNGQVWSLQLVGTTLFCGHNSGTFVVNDDSAELVSSFPGTWGVMPLKSTKELILQGNYNGLSILENKMGSWSLRNTIEGFDISSRFFEMDSLKVVVNHEQKGLYRLELDPGLRGITKASHEPRLGYGSNLFTFRDNLYYKAHTGIYGFDDSLKSLALDSTLTRMVFADSSEDPISIIIPDTTGQKLWFFTNNGLKYITQNTLSGKLSGESIPIPNALRINFGVSGFENISRIAEDEYLIGKSNGYVSLDLDKVKSEDYRVKINSIYFGNYRNVSKRTPLDKKREFDHSENNLKFEYSVAEFDKYSEVKYQYQLKGLYDEWSKWSDTPEITFNNLSFGEFRFIIRAKIGNSISENRASYSFTIRRPWYFSMLAIIFYGLGLVLLFFTIHRLYKRYYRRKQESLIARNERNLAKRRLEEKERIAQIVNEKLQDEIESKNRELAISTMSILKKNKFLNAIKSQLKNISQKENKIKSVIKEIDRNINSEDDWKFFEDAFNNADKDFLKKIKTKHDNLTNNDLRLCAYLRLNLSSKEIAPLLNISVKSVEMKRYRLRKKFDLPHQDNLIDYILSL